MTVWSLEGGSLQGEPSRIEVQRPPLFLCWAPLSRCAEGRVTRRGPGSPAPKSLQQTTCRRSCAGGFQPVGFGPSVTSAPAAPHPPCAGAEGVALREGEPGRGVSPSLVGANLGSVGSFRETVGFCHLGTTPAHVPEGKLTGPSSKGWKPEPGLFLIRGLRSRVPGLLLEGAAGFGQVPYSSPQEQ